MEDAVRAIKMAFAVFVFTFALSIAFYVLSLARATGEVVFFATDKTNYYDNVKANVENRNRIVGLETVIPTLYRYYKENFAVQIMDYNGTILQVFDTTTEQEVSEAYKAHGVGRLSNRQKTLLKIYSDIPGYWDSSLKNPRCMYGAPWIGDVKKDAKTRIDLYIKGEAGYIVQGKVDYTNTGLFKYAKCKFKNGTEGTITNKTTFEEIFTEYRTSGNYITVDENGNKLDDDERLVDDSQGTTKILITYKIVDRGE